MSHDMSRVTCHVSPPCDGGVDELGIGDGEVPGADSEGLGRAHVSRFEDYLNTENI